MTVMPRFPAVAVLLVGMASAIAASAAQAGETDIGAQPAVLFGHSEAGQVHIVTLTSTAGSKFNSSCPTASFEGTTQGQKINEETLTPTYSGNATTPNCTAFGVGAQVLANGCKFTITGAGQPSRTGVMDLVGCTSGKSAEVKTAICTIDIPEQNGVSHIVATNIASQEVTLSATMTGITVRQTGAACPDGNNHVSATGSATGNTLLKARVDANGSQVTKHGHQYQELAQTGAQVAISTT